MQTKTPATGSAPSADPVPVADTQRSILGFLSRPERNGDPYVLPLLLDLEGPLDQERFAAACAALADRHEALRTGFTAASPASDGTVVQTVRPHAAIDYRVRSLTGDGAAAAAAELVRAELSAGFAHRGEALFRVRLYRTGADRHLALLLFHHLTFDGWSAGCVLRDLDALYRGQDPSPEQRPGQYRDFIHWQAAESEPQRLRPSLEFWGERLDGFRPDGAIASAALRPGGDYTAGETPVAVPARLQDAVTAAGRTTGTTAYLLHTAAWALALVDVFGAQSFILASPMALRHRPGWADLVGDLTNMLVMPLAADPGDGMRDLVPALQAAHYPALAHMNVHYQRVLTALGRGTEYHARIGYHSQPDPPPALGGLRVRRIAPAGEAATRRLVSLELNAARPDPSGVIVYRRSLVTAQQSLALRAAYLHRLSQYLP
ncbi:condensation domain-containing protein [Streptacidiphilus cavernicola]|uniref:Condensation domain-containing protein n=1 Tax=Streptacidiphilus cavernicola TaxID=3342716 RepID=A0ABV6VZX0_9ACTN